MMVYWLILLVIGLGLAGNGTTLRGRAPLTRWPASTTGYTSLATPVDSLRHQADAPAGAVSVLTFGAVGDGQTDNGEAIQQAIHYARNHRLSAIYFPPGTYLIQPAKSGPGTIKLAYGVGLRGADRAHCILKLASGQWNPPALFYQAWWEEPEVSNILVAGLTFDGSLEQQRFDARYEYCHALSINNGHNLEVRNCIFRSWRGDGLLFGDTNEPTSDARITRDVRVHDNEFNAIYREGCMFCCTEGGAFFRNWIHGTGYLVGGVDIERHSGNETVHHVAVYNNLFDFRQGFGPAERGGTQVKYRRAVTMGFFYAGYPQGVADGRSGGHQIHDNIIYQGQIDCYGHTEVTITRNQLISVFENVVGVGLLTPHAILVADARTTTGLTGVAVNDNVIQSQMGGSGIMFNNYALSTAKNNNIMGCRQAGINLLNSSVSVIHNTITDVGNARVNAAGILVNGDCNSLIISHNIARNTHYRFKNFTSYTVKIGSYNQSKVPPLIKYNQAIRLTAGVVKTYEGQPNYALLFDNRCSRAPNHTKR